MPWPDEVLHLIDHVAERVQAAGGARLHRQDRAEPRWPVSAAIIVAIVLQWLLSPRLSLQPRFLLPALEGALLIGLSVANPVRIERLSGPIRAASVALILLITAANAASAGLLIKAIITSQLHVAPNQAPIALLASGAAIWGTNVIAFALWYWEFDRGGPVHRLQGTRPYPDLLFPQMTVPELTPRGLGAAVRGLPVHVVHERDGVQPDRCHAAGPVGQADDAGPVRGLARARRPGHRPCGEHPALNVTECAWLAPKAFP